MIRLGLVVGDEGEVQEGLGRRLDVEDRVEVLPDVFEALQLDKSCNASELPTIRKSILNNPRQQKSKAPHFGNIPTFFVCFKGEGCLAGWWRKHENIK